jgi:hypothetical protein
VACFAGLTTGGVTGAMSSTACCEYGLSQVVTCCRCCRCCCHGILNGCLTLCQYTVTHAAGSAVHTFGVQQTRVSELGVTTKGVTGISLSSACCHGLLQLARMPVLNPQQFPDFDTHFASIVTTTADDTCLLCVLLGFCALQLCRQGSMWLLAATPKP